MVFKVTMKTPDVLYDALGGHEAVFAASFFQKYKKLTDRWFEYGEYLTVEIDTDKETCTVCEVTQ